MSKVLELLPTPWTLLAPGPRTPKGELGDRGIEAGGVLFAEVWEHSYSRNNPDGVRLDATEVAQFICSTVNNREQLKLALIGMLAAYWPQNRDGSFGDGGKPPASVATAIAALEAEGVRWMGERP